MSEDLVFKVDGSGISVPPYNEILESFKNKYKTIYGEDIAVESNDPDGQNLAIWADLINDAALFGLFLASQIDPDQSKGQYLDRISKLAGMLRIQGSSSYCPCIITVDKDLELETGYTVEDVNGVFWNTIEDHNLTTGENEIMLWSVEKGQFNADVGDISEPVTIVLGVSSIENRVPATPGEPEETDEEMRERRNRSLETPAYSVVASLVGRLLQLDNVLDAYVHENQTSSYDPDKDMQSHSIWVLVDGGSEDEIADTIALNKTAGAMMKGNVVKGLVYNVPAPDGLSVPVPTTVAFDRPLKIDAYVQVTVDNLLGQDTPDYTPLQEVIAEEQLKINETLYANEFYEPALSITGPWKVRTITVGKKRRINYIFRNNSGV